MRWAFSFIKITNITFVIFRKQVGGLVMNKNENYGNWVPEKCWHCVMLLQPCSALPPA